MLKNLSDLERAYMEREVTDRRLINWWLFLLLSWITFGIVYFIVLTMRIFRRDSHFERMMLLFSSALGASKEVAQMKNIDASEEIEVIERKILEAELSLLRPKHAILWLVLILLTGGLLLLYVYYFLLVDWYRIQAIEKDLLKDFSALWLKLGIVETPVTVEITAPKRNYWLYLFLTVITLGIWAFYWDYVVHTDPEKVFPENVIWEGKILDSFRREDLKTAA
ncbi:MAG: DUF4234 domain-containing protein [Actinobacteria bacterium]|nr:MAG: DUF4234 domain-containing protein [Actinomycetota bacterium]